MFICGAEGVHLQSISAHTIIMHILNLVQKKGEETVPKCCCDSWPKKFILTRDTHIYICSICIALYL